MLVLTLVLEKLLVSDTPLANETGQPNVPRTALTLMPLSCGRKPTCGPTDAVLSAFGSEIRLLPSPFRSRATLSKFDPPATRAVILAKPTLC